MTLLSDLAATSRRVAATTSRLAKVSELAALLRRLAPDEIPIAIAFLSGEPRQGKLGIAYASLSAAREPAAAAAASLTLADVDAAFEALAGVRGKGATAQRAQALARLFERATPDEQDLLARLLVGELRQGAL
jgi:DNA ligase-1